jgi:hypothetical protein
MVEAYEVEAMGEIVFDCLPDEDVLHLFGGLSIEEGVIDQGFSFEAESLEDGIDNFTKRGSEFLHQLR